MEHTHETHEEHAPHAAPKTEMNAGQKQIAGAILLAAVIIGGAILLKGHAPAGSTGTQALQQVQDKANVNDPANVDLDPVTSADRVLGNAGASVAFVEYSDFQCPFCERFFTATEPTIRDYVSQGKIKFVYRDYAFLGPESTQAAQAAWCANDQGKFWEYHDYLFSHQNGENKGAFADKNLETFAATLGLDTTAFNSCLESGKYSQKVDDMMASGTKAGVTGTPKGFIVKNGKVVDMMNGAEQPAVVKAKIDAALK